MVKNDKCAVKYCRRIAEVQWIHPETELEYDICGKHWEMHVDNEGFDLRDLRLYP